jgi:hypothetical protein
MPRARGEERDRKGNFGGVINADPPIRLFSLERCNWLTSLPSSLLPTAFGAVEPLMRAFPMRMEPEEVGVERKDDGWVTYRKGLICMPWTGSFPLITTPSGSFTRLV